MKISIITVCYNSVATLEKTILSVAGQTYSDIEYIVVDGSATIPIAAKINDTGSVFTAKRYTTSAKTTLLGTRTVTYVVEADSGTTALVTLIDVDKNNAGTMTSTATSQYRITTANTFTKIKETLVDNVTGISLILTIVN